ncbi:glycosyl transferase [Burkholderia sp. WAC0059]|uniref:glycosyltransferase n=1 Tax=Burkholderia sp. WAC0059 TaxID=2066022 RepID=UPI000C7EDCF3|nr:glycosyltransferase [Burkholderia sp. WAC0059]PLZ04003.1 glycosyl transferase [Burkholderia sp. WAC0059]
MIGIGIPAHNEAALLGRCLQSVRRCAAHCALAGEAVVVVVALDSCTDSSAAVCAAHGVETIAVDVRNVGIARATAAAHLLQRGARWIACTDADSMVAPDWLAVQLAWEADAVCGTVCVDDWRDWPSATRAAFERGYHDADRHRHVHGANLGVSAAAYVRAGGFPPLACSEDVALVDALVSTGSNVVWSAALRVVTSGRRVARARGGFAATLAQLA